jgi:hypothetical protein
MERAGERRSVDRRGPTKSRLEGVLFSYRYLGDGRVNLSEGVVLRAGRAEKIAWYSKRWGGSRVTLTGRRLDGRGSFRQVFGASLGAGWYPSGITVPAAGCWELTLKTDGWTRRLVVQAVDPAPKETCDATPVGEDFWVKVRPLRSGISGGWGWKTPEGGALLYTGGTTPTGGNTKVLWRGRRLGGELVVTGSRLDGQATFRQAFRRRWTAGLLAVDRRRARAGLLAPDGAHRRPDRRRGHRRRSCRLAVS